MNKNMLIVGLSLMFSLSACSKSGGGGGSTTATNPVSASGCTNDANGYCIPGTGQLGDIGQMQWQGQMNAVGGLYNQFVSDVGLCEYELCQGVQGNLNISISLVDGNVPGIATYKIRAFFASYDRHGRPRLVHNDLTSKTRHGNGARVNANSLGNGLLISRRIGFGGYQYGQVENRLQIATTFTSSDRSQMNVVLLYRGQVIASGTMSSVGYTGGYPNNGNGCYNNVCDNSYSPPAIIGQNGQTILK